MHRLLPMLLLLGLLLPVYAGDDVKSGPQPGKVLPGSFAPLNLNGKSKDRPHCLVCEFGLDPVVAVFVRESPEANDMVLGEFLKKLDASCAKNQDDFLHGFVVFLAPEAKSSRTEKPIDEPDLIVKEAVVREKLTARLTELATPLKHVIVGMLPDGPAGYQINDRPGTTVLVYAKHRVELNFAFAEGKMRGEDADRILKSVDEILLKRKKKD